VKSSIHDYEVQFRKFSPEIAKGISFIDANVKDTHFANSPLPFSLIRVTEECKTIHSVVNLIDVMIANGLKRGEWITVIGGGVVQDIATLATSIYKRGLPWQFVPTTLQAMIDSCIGGKSSINHEGLKNVIGNFYPPTEILIDVEFLRTLPDSDLICGLIEGAKICAASGPEELERFISKARQLALPFNANEAILWESLIRHTLLEKRKFVEADEFDLGVRRLLNFGHTFGHAVEASTNYYIPHGIAVGIGILMAAEFVNQGESTHRSILTSYIEDVLQPVIPKYLPSLNKIDLNHFMMALSQDKKSERENYNFIVPTDIGLQIIKEEISEKTTIRINETLSKVIQKWRIS
jgi:3-dehydroquinate synthase